MKVNISLPFLFGVFLLLVFELAAAAEPCPEPVEGPTEAAGTFQKARSSI